MREVINIFNSFTELQLTYHWGIYSSCSVLSPDILKSGVVWRCDREWSVCGQETSPLILWRQVELSSCLLISVTQTSLPHEEALPPCALLATLPLPSLVTPSGDAGPVCLAVSASLLTDFSQHLLGGELCIRVFFSALSETPEHSQIHGVHAHVHLLCLCMFVCTCTCMLIMGN